MSERTTIHTMRMKEYTLLTGQNTDSLCALEERIIARVRHAECRQARVQALAFVGMSAGSFVIAYPLILSLMNSISESGLIEYMSLIVSDGTLFTTYWKEFTLTVLEIVPAASLAALLGVGIMLVWSIPRGVRGVRNSFVSA